MRHPIHILIAVLYLGLSCTQAQTPAEAGVADARQKARAVLLHRASAEGFAAADARASADVQADAAIERWLESRLKPDEPTEQALRARYQDLAAQMGPHEYRLSMLLTPDAEAAHMAHRRLSSGEDFATLARILSRAPSASRGGELGWFSFPLPAAQGRTAGLPLPVARALPGMHPGQVSAPLDIGDALVIVRLDEVRDTRVPPFEDVAQVLRDLYIRESLRARARALAMELRSAGE
jgi:parvulin-like peptidyl-prolyl isomerase